MQLYLTTFHYGQWLPMLENKHGSLKFTSSPTPWSGSNVNHLNFSITKSIVNILPNLSSFLTGRGTIDIKHIRWDLS